MKDKDILDILINSKDRLTECEIETLKRLKAENKELKENELDYTSIYLSGIFDERARWEKRIKEKIEWLEEISDNGMNAVRFAATYEDEIERKERQKNISKMIDILQELIENRRK